MIRLDDVHKSYGTRSGPVEVLRGVDLVVGPTDRLGIIGRNGAGKSTLIRLIGGTEEPDRGTVTRTMSVSWPLAFGGAFQGSLTGIDNIKFICRIYGADYRSKLDYIEEFSELGRYLREPVKSYSSGMLARLAFGISMAVEFDCYLIDEIVAVGDRRFQQKSMDELFVKRAHRAKIIISHDATYIREHCDRAAVLDGGRLRSFDDVDEALADHHRLMA